MTELEYKSDFRIVVSAGHAEYVPGTVGNMTLDWLWPNDVDVWGADPDELPELWAEENPGIVEPDADLGWESICLLRGSRADLEAWLAELLTQIGEIPSGDDDVFDYWPSGVRLALDVAEHLGPAPAGAPMATWSEMVASEAQRVIAEFPEWADELLGKCGLAPLDDFAHETAHRIERDGGEPVDRRWCQGIGCKYGDH